MKNKELVKYKWDVDKNKLNKNDPIRENFKDIKNLIDNFLKNKNFSQKKLTAGYLGLFKEFLITYDKYDANAINKFVKDFTKIIGCSFIFYDERSKDDIYDEDFYFFTKGNKIIHNKCIVVNRYTKTISIKSGASKYFSIYNNSNEEFSILDNW